MYVETLTSKQNKVLSKLSDELEEMGSIEIADDINDIIVDYSEIDED